MRLRRFVAAYAVGNDDDLSNRDGGGAHTSLIFFPGFASLARLTEADWLSSTGRNSLMHDTAQPGHIACLML
jgi:hypothetical protein